MMDHLYAAYVRITPANLERNDFRMKAPYDVTLPIEHLFWQIEDAVAYAAHGQAPIPPVKITNRAFTLVLNTGLFTDNCKVYAPSCRLPKLARVQNPVCQSPPRIA